MAINLRELAESDLSATLEGEFGLPVILTDPAGAQQTVEGQILYDRFELDPETGNPVVDVSPIVTLRRASLNPVPQDGEKWFIEIPVTPSRTAATESFVFTPDKALNTGGSIGYMKLYLQKVEQTP